MKRVRAEEPSEAGQRPRAAAREPSLAALINDSRGATMLEWVLLLAVIGLPSYWILQLSLRLLVDYYHMMTTLNGLPLP